MRKAWPFTDLPESVTLDGVPWARSVGWAGGEVVGHYREGRAVDARHLYVFFDRTYQIDHVDTFNPEYKHEAALHFVFDLLLKKFLLNR